MIRSEGQDYNVKKPLSDWHLAFLMGLSQGRNISNGMDTYLDLRSMGYVWWGGDGDICLTHKGLQAIKATHADRIQSPSQNTSVQGD